MTSWRTQERLSSRCQAVWNTDLQGMHFRWSPLTATLKNGTSGAFNSVLFKTNATLCIQESQPLCSGQHLRARAGARHSRRLLGAEPRRLLCVFHVQGLGESCLCKGKQVRRCAQLRCMISIYVRLVRVWKSLDSCSKATKYRKFLVQWHEVQGPRRWQVPKWTRTIYDFLKGSLFFSPFNNVFFTLPFFPTLETFFFHPQKSFFTHPVEPFFFTLRKPVFFTLHPAIFTL